MRSVRLPRRRGGANSVRFRAGPFQKLLYVFIALAGKWILFLYYLTIHITDGPQPRRARYRDRPLMGIFPFWHSHQLATAWHCRLCRSAILISRSADGEYVARLVDSLGYYTVRGSSSRGAGPGLKAMVACADRPYPISITPDGPKGPRQTVKPGVLLLAQMTGRPIQPAAIGFSDLWELPSWDRFRIPKPFSRGYYCWGEEMAVPSDASQEQLDALAEQLRRQMVELEAHADEMAQALAGRRVDRASPV